MQNADAPSPEKMFDMLLAPIVCQAIGAMARLGIADLFGDGPLSTDTIAESVGAAAGHLRRILQVLADHGLFTAEPGDAWSLTATGALLKSDVPGSMRHMAILQTDAAHWGALGRMTDCVRSGESQAVAALGTSVWEFYQKHPEDADSFSKAMANVSAMSIDHVLANYDFSGEKTIVDVAGAYGAMLAAVLRQNPAVRGVLFDQPHVLAGADQILGEVSPRVKKAPGSFFTDEIPAGDIYILKHILHDWNDAQCLKILHAIRQSMKPGSKLLVVEFHVPEEGATGPVLRLDLLMMVTLDGKERTSGQLAELFAQAGLKHTRTIPTESPFSLIEAEPVF